MRALCEGVNNGVRSSCAVNAHNSASDALKRALEVILYRVAMRLALPAGERRTVVSDDEFQSPRHGNVYDFLHATENMPKRREDACALQKLPRNNSIAFDEFRTEWFGSAMRLRIAFSVGQVSLITEH